jgi:hypothetical protein
VDAPAAAEAGAGAAGAGAAAAGTGAAGVSPVAAAPRRSSSCDDQMDELELEPLVDGMDMDFDW